MAYLVSYLHAYVPTTEFNKQLPPALFAIFIFARYSVHLYVFFLLALLKQITIAERFVEMERLPQNYYWSHRTAAAAVCIILEKISLTEN